MSIGSSFFTYPIAVADSGLAPRVLCQAWSNSDVAYLATALGDGRVKVYSEEDDSLALIATIARTSNRTSVSVLPPLVAPVASPQPIKSCFLSWHPTSATLLVCWEDGGMTVWRPTRGIVTDDSPDRLGAVAALAWAPQVSSGRDRDHNRDGGRFVLGDQNGQVVICTLDNRDKLVVIRRFVRQSAILHIVFRRRSGTGGPGASGTNDGFAVNTVPSMSTSSSSSAGPDAESDNCFFFGTRAGTVFHVNEGGVCTELCTLGCALVSLHYDAPAAVLYLVATDATYARLQIGADGRVVNERKARLGGISIASTSASASASAASSTSSSSSTTTTTLSSSTSSVTSTTSTSSLSDSDLRVAWAGRAVLAAVNNDNEVRLWHLEDDDSYTLPITSAARSLANDKLRAVAFDAASQTLIAATDRGCVCLWKHSQRVAQSATPSSTTAPFSSSSSSASVSASSTSSSSASSSPSSSASPADWEIQPLVYLPTHDSVTSLSVRPTDSFVSVAQVTSLTALKRNTLLRAFRDGASAVQIAPDTILIARPDAEPVLWRLRFRARGIDVRGTIALAWGHRRVEVVDVATGSPVALGSFTPHVYQHQQQQIQLSSSFLGGGAGSVGGGSNGVGMDSSLSSPQTVHSLVLGDQTIFAPSRNGSRIDFLTFAGVVRHTLDLTADAAQGLSVAGGSAASSSSSSAAASTLLVDVSPNGVLACVTAAGSLKLWDVSRREVKPLLAGRSLGDDVVLQNAAAAVLSAVGKRPKSSTGTGADAGASEDAAGGSSTSTRRASTSAQPGLLSISGVRVNATGSRVAMFVSSSTGALGLVAMLPLVAVYDTEADSVFVYNLPNPASTPMSLAWDPKHPHLLAVEHRRQASTRAGQAEADVATSSPSGAAGASKLALIVEASSAVPGSTLLASTSTSSAQNQNADLPQQQQQQQQQKQQQLSTPSGTAAITTLFFSADGPQGAGLFVQEDLPISPVTEALLGVSVPHIVMIQWSRGVSGTDSASSSSSSSTSTTVAGDGEGVARRPTVLRRSMRDFAGAETADEQTHADLLKFSYHLALGALDEAHRAVQKIQAPAVWRNMAVMSVRTHRLDVAKICIAHMQDARTAWLMRDAVTRNDGAPSMDSSSSSSPSSSSPNSTTTGANNRSAGAVFSPSASMNSSSHPSHSSSSSSKSSASGASLGSGDQSTQALSESDAVQLAALAVSLGLDSEAEVLYRSVGRLDLVVELLQAQGRFDHAIQFCEKNARVQVGPAHHALGRYLELMGHRDGAATEYERADSARAELPRMLAESAQAALIRVLDQSADPALAEWMGLYLQSKKAMREAVMCFTKANLPHRLVDAYIRMGQIERAEAICKQSNDPSACLSLARQFEATQGAGMIEKAVDYYVRARRFGQGIRLCREYNLPQMMQKLAIESPPALQQEVARFFEDRGQIEQAVLLYQRGGNPARAVELCFSSQLFGPLRTIIENIGPDADPALLSRCADYFLMHNHYDRAVHLLVSAGRSVQALQLIQQHNIPIDENIAERLTPPKSDNETDAERAERKSVLNKIAQVCKDQGLFQLACKKYTQAGDAVRAIKCLLKARDTDKVVYYAQKLRNKDVWLLAARYLEHLGWREDEDIMKKIISFYTSARAYDALAVFYELCAQHEIDEKRSYEKAAEHLRDSYQWLMKARSLPASPITDAQIRGLDTRLRLVQQFVDARKLVRSDPATMVRSCEALIAPASHTKDSEAGLRAGDIFALLVEYHHSVREDRAAFVAIQRMREQNIPLGPYLDPSIVNAVLVSQGVDPAGFDTGDQPMYGGGGYGTGDQQGEEVEDGIEEALEGM